MLTFDGKSEKFELFEDLFQNFENPQPAGQEDKINYFHSLMRVDALQQPQQREFGRNPDCFP